MIINDSAPPRTRPTHYPIRSFYVALTLAELEKIIEAIAHQGNASDSLIERLDGIREAEQAKA